MSRKIYYFIKIICRLMSADVSLLFGIRFCCIIHSCVALLGLELLIENCGGSLHIGGYPKRTDSASECAEKRPTKEAEIEPEQAHFVALHHLFALVKTFSPSVLGVVCLYVVEE